MKINSFKLDIDLIGFNRLSLSNTILMEFYKEVPALIQLLNYEDDSIFLEPSLFCYFLSDIESKCKIPLLQSVLGFLAAKRPKGIWDFGRANKNDRN